MNKIASDVAIEVQQQLKQIKTTSANVPLGTAFKSSILAKRTKVRVIIPFTSSYKEVFSQMPVCETIVVGKVPQNYVSIPKEDVGNIIDPNAE